MLVFSGSEEAGRCRRQREKSRNRRIRKRGLPNCRGMDLASPTRGELRSRALEKRGPLTSAQRLCHPEGAERPKDPLDGAERPQDLSASRILFYPFLLPS